MFREEGSREEVGSGWRKPSRPARWRERGERVVSRKVWRCVGCRSGFNRLRNVSRVGLCKKLQ